MSASTSEQGQTDGSFLRQVFSSTMWQGMGQVLANVASFATKLILARLLAPEHFGLVGMAVVFIGFLRTIEKLGIREALVQRPESDLTDTDLYTGHIGAIVVGVVFYLFVILPGAPAVAWFYDEPQLVAIVIVLGLPVLLHPFAVITRVFLERDLQFKELAKVEIFATFVGAAGAIGLAFAGAGVWALVAQWLIYAVLHVITLRLLYHGPPKDQFSIPALKRILVFGGYVTGQRIFTFISKQSDYLIVGRLVGAASLGAYTIAFMLTDAIRSKLMSVLSKVLYSAYSRLQDDIDRLNEYYLGSIRVNTLVVAPVLCAFFVYTEPLLKFGFGEEWLEGVEALKLLSVAALIHVISGTSSKALKAVNRPELAFKVKMYVSLGVMIPALLVGVYYFELVGAGAAVILSKLVYRFALQFLMNRHIGTTEPQVLRAIAPALVAIPCMAATMVGLDWMWPVDSLLQTLGFIFIATMMYLAVVTPMVWGELKQLWSAFND